MSPKNVVSPSAWLDRLDASRHALLLLFLASFLETLVVPIPIEVILIPWMLCRPSRKWAIAGVALAGNLTAATLGYFVGMFAMDAWGDSLIAFFGGEAAYEAFQARFAEEGFLAILAIGVVPIPFQIAMLVAGASGYAFPLFLAAAALARGLRYFGLALLVKFTGDMALQLWERHSMPIGLVGLAALGTWGWFEFAG